MLDRSGVEPDHHDLAGLAALARHQRRRPPIEQGRPIASAAATQI